MKIKICFATILIFLCSMQVVFAQENTQTQQKKVLVCSDCGFPLNAKPIFLPEPEYPKAALMVGASGTVQVQITIDENGNVESAKAISGHPLLQAESVKVAVKSKWKPIKLSGKPIKVTGLLIFNFVSDKLDVPNQNVENSQQIKGKPIVDFSRGIVVGMAIKLPKPSSVFCNCRFGNVNSITSVVVLADIDKRGNVIKAVAVSGHPILKVPTQKAAEESIFNPTLISGVPTKVRRAIVYKFKVINKWSAKVTQIKVVYSSGINK